MSRQTAIILALTFFAASAAATFSMSSIIKQAEVIKVNAVTAATNSAITVSTTIRGFAANDPYQIKKLSVPKATFLGGLKNGFGGGMGNLMKRNAWYAGWFATMAATGWAIDELSDQMVQPLATWRGRCVSTYSYIPFTQENMLLNDCASKIASLLAAHPQASLDGYTYSSFTKSSTSIDLFFVNQWGNTPHPRLATLQNIQSVPLGSQSVPDDALYDSLIAEFLKDPLKAAQAFMVPDAYPYPYPGIFPSSVPYVPNVSESDQSLLDLYSQGLLQSTNPNAEHYVSPEKYNEIASLAAQLAQGATPEGEVEQANNNLKNPLTQKQLEETLKKRDEASKKEADEISAIDKKPITDAYKDSKLKDEYDKLKERVTDPSKLPQLPPLPAADQISYPSYKVCRTITTNIFTGVLVFPSPDQCQKLEQIKTGLGYLLYLLTAMGIISELFKRVE